MTHSHWLSKYILVLVLIVPGLRAQEAPLLIESITITGDSAYSDQDIIGLMNLKSTSALQGNPFSRRVLRLDLINIQAFYTSNGYLETLVTDSIFITESNTVKIIVNISEGRLFLLTEVNMTGNHLLTADQIMELLDLRIGEPYNPGRVTKNMEALKNYFLDQGKLGIDILKEEFDVGGIHLRLTISEGETYRIGQIDILGLIEVPEKYVFRELLLSSGDTFSRRLLLRSQERVFESGMFSMVEIIPSINVENPGVANIVINLRELESRSIEFRLGFKQEEPIISGDPPGTAISTGAEWWHSRIFNTSIRSGITLEANLAIAANQEALSPNFLVALDFISPWILNWRIPASIRLYADYRTIPDYINRNGADLSFYSKPLGASRFRGSIGWVLIDADPELSDSVITAKAERSIRFEYLYQGVDNLLAPTKGTILQFKPSVHFPIKGLPYYAKIEAEIKQYMPIFGTVLAYRLQGAYLYTGDDEVKLARYDRFALGGSTSLRGWQSPNNFAPNGGTIRGLANLEWRFPLFWILGGEIFAEGGSLYAYPDTGPLEWVKGWDYGAGLLFQTGLGPIRIDVAIPQGEGWTPEPTYQVAFLHTF